MGLPDMATPIAYALSHPARAVRDVAPLDLAAVGALTFSRPEGRLARAVELGFEAIRRGGSAGAVLNGANEAAVFSKSLHHSSTRPSRQIIATFRSGCIHRAP